MTEFFNSEAIERYASDNNTDEESVMSSTEVVVPNLKLEIMMRKEKERKDDEANYTFRPKVKGEIKKKNNSYQDSESDRFSRLYSDAVKRKVEQKHKQKIEPELTFKPYITSKASSRASSRERSGQWVGERLYTTAANKTANNSEKQKQNGDNNFTPVISRRAKSIERSNEKDTCDRLYKQSKVLREKMEKVQQEKSTKALDGCTFTPRTTGKASGGGKSSSELRFDPAFPDRMKRYDESRIKRVEEKMQSKIEDELKNATFRPQLVTKSKHAPGTDPNIPVHQRLASLTSKDLSTIEAEYYAESTFKPQRVTKSTRRSTSASPLRAPHQEEFASVHERLYKIGEQKLKEIEHDRQQLREELKKQTPFKPVINPSRHRDYEDEPIPVFNRLNAADNRSLMDEVLAKIKTEIELRGCTFQPTLIARRRPSYQVDEPVHARLSLETEAAKAQQAKKVTQKVAEELSTSALSFAPHLPEQSVEIARRRSLVLNVITGTDHTDVYSRLASQ
mmetsp:Transcript_22634/g.31012  ORF Transcript_22634/g.31012 Transcript_22634/m.31012 type:complete len:507 (+) Transcript_22634:74-1594(+)